MLKPYHKRPELLNVVLVDTEEITESSELEEDFTYMLTDPNVFDFRKIVENNKLIEKDWVSLFTAHTSTNNRVLEASYQISLFIAKTGKNHTIGENLIKPSISAFLKTVLEKDDKDAKAISLRKNTVTRRIDEMDENIEKQLVEKLKTRKFSVQMDESTLRDSEAVLITYVATRTDRKHCACASQRQSAFTSRREQAESVSSARGLHSGAQRVNLEFRVGFNFRIIPEQNFSRVENVVEFLENIDNNLTYCKILTQLACAYLKGHLTGRALDWFEVLGNRVVEDKVTDYAHLKQALSEQFPVVRNRLELETRFYSSQKHNQKPSDFVYDLLKIRKILKLEMTEEKLIDHIISRLEPQNLDYVEVKHPLTTCNILKIINKYEELFLNRKIRGSSWESRHIKPNENNRFPNRNWQENSRETKGDNRYADNSRPRREFNRFESQGVADNRRFDGPRRGGQSDHRFHNQSGRQGGSRNSAFRGQNDQNRYLNF
ncbi:uncharacterized protein TNCV_4489131 [Trichonephila clavipes]|nr:uncharacterized protein TNCV_4489131 [Trichonephila clavipes]